MKSKIARWVRKAYHQIIGSIAFYPALIAIGFLALSWLMIEFDFSETGKHIKSNYQLIRLRDASTARSIASTIITSIISLAVFSFSMVMILLNQAASQLSNRMLESMIGNRFQQIVLGLYLGTIVYALFLLSTIRDVDSGIYVPALSIYLLILLVVGDVFMFIYFLHYVTQSVKFETIIKRVHHQTYQALQNGCVDDGKHTAITPPDNTPCIIAMPTSNYFQGIDIKQALEISQKNNLAIECLHPVGSYLLQGLPLLKIYGNSSLSAGIQKELLEAVDLFAGQAVERNAYYGFKQLAEVAIKALSPGINDPATAVLSLHALTDLFRFRSMNPPQSIYTDNEGTVRIHIVMHSFKDLFDLCFLPVLDYGKDDRYIQKALKNMMMQLKGSITSQQQQQLIDNFLLMADKKALTA